MNLRPCGTDAAYARHRRHGEVPCASCKKAHSVAQSMATHARTTALTRLSRAHPKEFRAYYADELANARGRRLP